MKLISNFTCPILITFATVCASVHAERERIVLADFESRNFGEWTTQDKAFGPGPLHPTEGSTITNFEGKGLAATLDAEGQGEQLRGVLRSPSFPIDRNFLNFQIAGGKNAFRGALNLWVGDRIVRTTTGNGSDRLEWASWDVTEFEGQQGQLAAWDYCHERQGYLLLDSIELSDSAKAPVAGDVEPALLQVRRDGIDLLRSSTERAAEDPYRPVYHYTPPAQRMNDPNGTVFHDGFYHLFYQHNIFADRAAAGHMLWGHARSRDLVNWETLPIAIWPSWELGEQQCYSGNFAWDGEGNPMQFYTMVPSRDIPREQWAARPTDEDWFHWEKHPANPILTMDNQGGPRLPDSWRDPFLETVDGKTFMTLAAGNVPLYVSTDDSLTSWTYKGVLYEREGFSAECPNFFQIGDKWILISSPKGPVEYVIGNFDTESCEFTEEAHGYLNGNGHYYATTITRDDKGRCILYGLIKGFKNGRGWRGALAMPRVLTLGADGLPMLAPAPEFEQLRHDPYVGEAMELNNDSQVVPGLQGDVMEIVAEFQNTDATSFGIRVRRSEDGKKYEELKWDDGQIVVKGAKIKRPYPVAAQQTVTFRIFLDKGALELFVDDGKLTETRVIYSKLENLGVEVFAEGGQARLTSLKAWQMEPVSFPDLMDE